MSDADWAKFLVKFFKAKAKQDLNGKKDKALAALAAAGLPLWYDGKDHAAPIVVPPAVEPTAATVTVESFEPKADSIAPDLVKEKIEVPKELKAELDDLLKKIKGFKK